MPSRMSRAMNYARSRASTASSCSTTRILALQEQVFAIRRQQEEVRQEVRGARKSIFGVLGLVVALLAAICSGQWWMKHRQSEGARKVIAGQKEILSAQKFDAPALRAHILEYSERKRDADLAAAKLAGADEENLREAAHRSRTDPARVDDVVSRFQELSGMADATPVTTEFLRLMGKDPDAALAYIERQKAGVLASVDADRDRIRVKLAPLLSAADLLVTKGDTAATRTAYRELLQRDPAWPAALEAFAWFLFDQSIQNLDHRTVVAALADAEEAHTLATRWHEAAPADAKARRLLSATHTQMGDVLIRRGQPGDAAQVEQHFTRSLDLAEKLLADNPGSAQAVRDVAVSHYKIAGFANRREDEKEAEQHYRAIHDLLKPHIEAGMTFDPPIVKLYETLKAKFAK